MPIFLFLHLVKISLESNNGGHLRNSHKKMIKQIILLLKNSNGIGIIFNA
jgi:hypothetical protein